MSKEQLEGLARIWDSLAAAALGGFAVGVWRGSLGLSDLIVLPIAAISCVLFALMIREFIGKE